MDLYLLLKICTARKTVFSFSRRLEKMVFPKKSCWNMIFLVLSVKMIFLFPENSNPLDGKWKMIFLKKYMETWYFPYIRTDATKTAPCPATKRNQRWSYPAKINLQMIDILDWHSRKSSNIFLYLYGDLYRSFHILLFSEENQET